MNRLLTTLAVVLTLGATLPAIAGPDFQVIEQSRKAVEARAAMEKGCQSRRLVLPRDHGPRSTSTPHLNQLRKERFDADMRKCKEAAIK